MLAGGLLAKPLLARYTVNFVIKIGLIGIAAGIINLILIWDFASHSALWFFMTSASLYLFSSLLFSGGSLVASNALSDKASGAAMMSFINMCFATVSVIFMGYVLSNPLLSFIITLSLIWIMITLLLTIYYFTHHTNAHE